MENNCPGAAVEETVAGRPELVVAVGSIHEICTDVAPGGPFRMMSSGQPVTVGGVWRTAAKIKKSS